MVGVINDIKNIATMNCYRTGDRDFINKSTFEKLPAVERYMADKQFVAGDYITFADFIVLEALSLLNFISGDNKVLETFPNLRAYFERITGTPEAKEYL